MTDFKRYRSSFSWRYGSDEMRHIWSEHNKRLLWREIWVAVAQVQADMGLISQEQVKDLRLHVDHVDIPRALEIEAEIHHDLMAELKTFAEQVPAAGGILHLGMTSMDVVDNADVLIDVVAGVDSTLADMGDAVTYEYNSTTSSWWRISGCGI